MCGNLGLLLCSSLGSQDSSSSSTLSVRQPQPSSDLELGGPSSRPDHLSTLLSSKLPLNHNASPKICERAQPYHDPISLIEDMASLTEIRGGQSAGLALVSWYGDDGVGGETPTAAPPRRRTNFFRDRSVVQKRRTGSKTLVASFRGKSSELRSSSSSLLIGHLRFATSSRNSALESHPHVWLPWSSESVWVQVPVPSGPHKGGGGGQTYVRRTMPVGHVLTHNGDFDAIHLYPSSGILPMTLCGQWLNRVLHHPSSVNSDSAKVAGYFDVFSTKGRWAASARRAWCLKVATTEKDACGQVDLSEGAPNTAPAPNVTNDWGRVFDALFESNNTLRTVDPGARRKEFLLALSSFEAEVAKSFLEARHTYHIDDWTSLQVQSFVSETVTGFFSADCFSTMMSFLRGADGSFGLAVSSAVECGSVVIAAHGQPMTFALDPAADLVMYGSESSAVRAPVQAHGAPLRYRYPVNDAEGEAVRIGWPNGNDVMRDAMKEAGKDVGGSSPGTGFPNPIYTSFKQGISLAFDCLGRQRELAEIVDHFRLQPVAATIPKAGTDPVAEDLNDIPTAMKDITVDWGNMNSANRITALDFVHLLSDVMFRHETSGGKRGIDLLITGIESSLWLGQQLASDLKIIFPTISCVAVSANKILGSLENVPRMVHFCGYNRIRGEDLRRDRPVVLCLSQSGQTFATLRATRQLLSILGGNVFLLTGEVESKMKEAVVDCLGAETGSRRVMCNLSGLRISEASTVATCAMHHTLTELLLYVGQCACVVGTATSSSSSLSTPSLNSSSTTRPTPPTASHAVEMNVVKEDLIDFRDLVDALLDDLPELVFDKTYTNNKLRAQGQLWALHISESWRVSVLSGIYIFAAVVSGYPIFHSILLPAKNTGAFYFAAALDALLFIFLPKLLSYLLRLIEKRTVFARHGKRSLVICDVPWVSPTLTNPHITPNQPTQNANPAPPHPTPPQPASIASLRSSRRFTCCWRTTYRSSSL